MKSNLQQALNYIREHSSNNKELGEAFESLAKIYLEHDAVQVQEPKHHAAAVEGLADEHRGVEPELGGEEGHLEVARGARQPKACRPRRRWDSG